MEVNFEELEKKYDEVIVKVKTIYESNIEKFTEMDLDTRVLYPDKEFLDFINYKKLKIKSLSVNTGYKKIIELFYSELEDELHYCGIESLGTTLNYLREFYPDLLNLMKRKKIDTD